MLNASIASSRAGAPEVAPADNCPVSTSLAIPSVQLRPRTPSLQQPLALLSINDPESEAALAHTSASPVSSAPSPEANDSTVNTMDVDAAIPTVEKEATSMSEPSVALPELATSTRPALHRPEPSDTTEDPFVPPTASASTAPTAAPQIGDSYAFA